MKPTEWILTSDTGTSSKTIWAVMMDVAGVMVIDNLMDFDVPHDSGDFGRCYRLLQHFPEWRPRLHRVAKEFPKWGPMVWEWDRLTELYEMDELAELDRLLRVLEKDGREFGRILK